MYYVLLFVAIVLLLCSTKAWAYIDPNAGGFLWQVAAPLAALALTSLLYFKSLVRKSFAALASSLIPTARPYVFALLSVSLATAINFALQRAAVHGTFMIFMVSSVATASVAGLAPSILSTALGALSSAYWFLPPDASIAISQPSDRIRLVLYVICALVSALTLEWRRNERRSAAGD